MVNFEPSRNVNPSVWYRLIAVVLWASASKNGISPRVRMPAPTARIRREAYPRPRNSASVHTALIWQTTQCAELNALAH